MKLVDSDALIYVNPALGVPAQGQTEFDDENLQQVWDVGPLMPGLGPQDGYFSIRLENVHAASGALDTSADPYTNVVAFGGNRNSHRVWLLDAAVWAEGVAGNSVTSIEVSSVLPVNAAFPNADARFSIIAATVFSNNGVTSTSTFTSARENSTTLEQLIRRMQVKTPWQLFPNSAEPIVMRSVAAVAAGMITARVELLLWAGRRGRRPPGM